MAVYLASDVHLRLDCPARGRRFARFLAGLDPEQDTLTIVGDLCDFWFVARQLRNAPLVCTGLSALADFRSRGGGVTILLALGPDLDLQKARVTSTSTRLAPKWESLGGKLFAAPAALLSGANEFDVFGVAADNALWWRRFRD